MKTNPQMKRDGVAGVKALRSLAWNEELWIGEGRLSRTAL